MSGSTGWVPLLPHPDSVSETALISFEARVVQSGDRLLRFEYRAGARPESAQGAVQLRMPRASALRPDSHLATDGRTADLWQETCCEAFLRVGAEPCYLEFNFAPSGQWAAYEFSAYRTGMSDLAIRAPRIDCRVYPTTTATTYRELVPGFELQATIELPKRLWPLPMGLGSLYFALTAVLQLGREGLTTYWSLRHPPGKPDFHDPSNFALTLPAPTAASS